MRNAPASRWVNSVSRWNFRAPTNTRRRRAQWRTRATPLGIATIEGDTAIFKPEGAEQECQITLKFTARRTGRHANGICGFGHNVIAKHLQKSFIYKDKLQTGLRLLSIHLPVASRRPESVREVAFCAGPQRIRCKPFVSSAER
ncbi:MAG: hypothetical protein DMF05_02385 [Verrucomicrobia bacterium]|nr:MAG: hypothetical protein DMF05_02385 [Verrucomicrobiota bacterium]